VLSSLFITQVVTEVGSLLERTHAGDRVVVCDQSRFGKALGATGVPVMHVAAKRGSLRRRDGQRIYGSAGRLPLADGSVSAVIGFGLGQHEHWQSILSEWARAVREDGQIVLVDKSPKTELTRRVLCSGLAGIEQQTAGRYVITSGAVTRLPG